MSLMMSLMMRVMPRIMSVNSLIHVFHLSNSALKNENNTFQLHLSET